MTLTFAPLGGPDPRYRAVCADESTVGEWADYDTAVEQARRHGLACTADAHLCRQFGADLLEVWPPELAGLASVELGSRNALDVLALLGLMGAAEFHAAVAPSPLGGTLTVAPEGGCGADDLIARIDTALAVGFDDGQLVQIALGRRVDGGRRPGYLTEKLGLLRVLAAACRVHDLPVRWY